MDIYNYIQQKADRLKNVEHKQVLRSFGIESLDELHTQLSRIGGTCMILVDAAETARTDENHDSQSIIRKYTLLILHPTTDTNTESIFEATRRCEKIAIELDKAMQLDSRDSKSEIYRCFAQQIKYNGVGPIADNFYGIALEFNITENFIYKLDPEQWQ